MSQCHRNRRCDVRYIVRCHLWIQTAHFGYKTTQVSSLCTLLTESGQNFGCHFGRPKVGDLIGSAVLMWAADIARCIAPSHPDASHRSDVAMFRSDIASCGLKSQSRQAYHQCATSYDCSSQQRSGTRVCDSRLARILRSHTSRAAAAGGRRAVMMIRQVRVPQCVGLCHTSIHSRKLHPL